MAASDSSAVKVWERDNKLAGKMTVATRFVSCYLISSFGDVKRGAPLNRVSSELHADKSQNHTLTVKYKTRSYLQMIGRVPKGETRVVQAFDQAAAKS
jgi:hypothetical protein